MNTKKNKTLIIWVISTCFFLWKPSMAQQENIVHDAVSPILKEAVMCERIQDELPVNPTIIFEIAKASAYCWSEFDPVSVDGMIYHEWYRKDVLISKKKLAVHPPRWASYSSLPLRQVDIGPWRLDITNENGHVLKTLRFSITE